jgi:DNA polymerase I-like protein with 3'-5' exonuclease and polymerase domains
MIEADYSQLEVVGQGVLSGDANLCQSLRDHIDFHCKRVSAKFGISYEDALYWCKNEDAPDYAMWKKRRTGVKEFSFQRAYGAGAPAIAAATGLPLADVEELIRVEDELFPGIIQFNADVESEVKRTSEPFQAVSDDGSWKTYRRGYWRAPTGTTYSFRSYDAQAWQRKRGITDSFAPPEMKNYPVQGTSGEFVQGVLGLLWRHFISTDFYNGKAYLVNTVHDCVWVDCHKSVLDQVAADMKRIMESIPEYYNNRYGMNITVPFPVEVEYGPNMNNLHHWKPVV